MMVGHFRGRNPMQSRLEPLSLLLDRAALASLLLVTVFAPVAMGGVVPWALLGIRLLVVGGVTLWLLSACLRGSLALPPPPILLALLAYLAAVIISTLLSPYTFGSVQTALNIFVYSSAFLLSCGLLTTRKRKHLFIGTLVVTAFVMSVYGVLQFLGYQWTPMLSPVRISSFYYNSNHYSGYLALLVPLVMFLCIYVQRVFLKISYGLLAALLLFNLALTFSWGLLAVSLTVFGLLVHWAVQSGQVRRFALATTVACLLGIAGLGALVGLTPQLSNDTLQTRTSEFFDVWVRYSVLSRVAIGEGTLKVIQDHPTVGVGPGNFIYAFTEHRAAEVTDENDPNKTLHKFVNYSHNDYTQVASETGFLGLAGFLSFWLLVIRGGVSGGISCGLVAGLVALLLHGATDGNLTVIPANVLLAYLFAGALHSGSLERKARLSYH